MVFVFFLLVFFCVSSPYNTASSFTTHGGGGGGGVGVPVCVVSSSGFGGHKTVVDDGVKVENVVVVGSGPAGYTSALYAGRAQLRPLVIEGIESPGGQLMTTSDVENFPGFPDGISGSDLVLNMRRQAARWGSRLVGKELVSVDFTKRPFELVLGGSSGGGDAEEKTERQVVRSNSLILATGASARRLGLRDEERFWGRGISSCAVCDGASVLFKGKPVGVVGGGDSAAEEAAFLTKYASEVHMFVRGTTMRAGKTLQARVRENPRIKVHLNTQVVDLSVLEGGADPATLGGVVLKTTDAGVKCPPRQWRMPLRGLFYAIGHTPNTASVRGTGVSLTKHAYVAVRPGSVQTNIPGVFAAGDVQDPVWRQAVTAAATGCMAGLAAESYLARNGLLSGGSDGGGVASQPAGAAERQQRGAKMKSASVTDDGAFDHSGGIALRRLYHESSRPLLVSYSSPHCGPCKILAPRLGEVSRADGLRGRFHFVKIDVDLDPAIAEQAGVTGTPTVHIFHNKRLVRSFPGVKPREVYVRELSRLLAQQEEDDEKKTKSRARTTRNRKNKK